MRFANKNAVVTGASSGIGKAVCRLFENEGARVAPVSRNSAFSADLRSAGEREKCAEQLLKHFGNSIDIVVHAAGIIGSGTIENTKMEQWTEMMEINVTSIFHLSQLLLPALIARKGNMVIVSSVAGTRSFPGILAYGVSKAAVDQFTRCSALELSSKGVRVNAVNPGVVITELHRRGGMNEEAYEKFLQHSTTTHPLGRVGKPEEVADLIAFLASDQASWITGVTYSIDGGRALTCAR